VLRLVDALLPPPQAARGSICPCHATDYGKRAKQRTASATSPQSREIYHSRVKAHVSLCRDESQPPEAHVEASRLQVVWFPSKQSRIAPRPAQFLLRCVRSVDCLHTSCISAPPMPSRCQLASTTQTAMRVAILGRCRHSLGWLGLTQGKIVRALMGTNSS
jgi:hypothetical protein